MKFMIQAKAQVYSPLYSGIMSNYFKELLALLNDGDKAMDTVDLDRHIILNEDIPEEKIN